MTNLDRILKSRDITLPTNICMIKAMVFPVVSYVQMWELDHKEGWTQKNWCFWTVVLEKTLESPLNARRSNQPILKGSNPEHSLQGLMLKLKFQYFGHLIQRADSFEKTLMLGKVEDRRSGHQRMWWLHGFTNSVDMSLSTLQETVKDRKPGMLLGISKSQKWLNDWTTTAISQTLFFFLDMYHPIILTPSYDKYSYSTQAWKSISNLSRVSKCYIWEVWFEQGWYTL